MKKIIFMVMCCLFITSGVVFAEKDKSAMPMDAKAKKEMRHGGGYMGGSKMEMMLPKQILNILTDEQKTAIKKMNMEHQRQMIVLEAEIKTLRLDIKELMDSDNPDEKKINDKIDQMSVVLGKIEKAKIGMFIKMKKTLTPEQIKKMKELKKERMGKVKEYKGKIKEK